MEFTDRILLFFSEHRFLITVFLLLFIWMLRWITINAIYGDVNFLSAGQRKWIATTKNLTFILCVSLIFLIWRSEINQFALSLTAIAIAVVVASKEIILCFTGSIQRASSRSFSIGEWIEIGSLCGEVIDHNLMATKIQEIDLKNGNYAYTGKTVTFPNSMLFTTPIKNLNFMKRYVYHEFNIVIKNSITQNIFPLIPILLVRIDEHCDDFHDVAIRYNYVIERRAGVDLPGADPYVYITTSDLGDQKVNIRLFCPTERASELEQLIREDFMGLYQTKLLNQDNIAIVDETHF